MIFKVFIGKHDTAMFMSLIELETQILITNVTKKESETKDIVFLIEGPEQHLHPSMQLTFLINLRKLVVMP